MIEGKMNQLKVRKILWSFSRDVEGYCYSRYEKVGVEKNIYLMQRTNIECDYKYQSSRSDEDDDASNPVERNYCYMDSNDPPGRNII